MSIGNEVSEQRKKKGFTQEELAALTNVTVRTIQRIEKGESLPRSFTLKAIAKALEVLPESLLETELEPQLPATIHQGSGAGQESTHHFLRLLCLSCFSYLVLPYIHFLLPVSILKAHKPMPLEVMGLAQKIIRRQILWTVCFHLLLLLTLAYNILQARHGSRLYIINYLWIVLGMYLLNAAIIGTELRQTSRLVWQKAFANH